MTPNDRLRQIPAVEKVAAALGERPEGLPRPMVVDLVRREIASLRERVRKGNEVDVEFDAVVEAVRAGLRRFARSRIAPVVNGTGVLIHTNLGRSPLGAAVASRLADVARSYCNIEIDLTEGERGPRAGFLETALATLCRTEAATVVNNCAAALVLILKHLATGEKNEVVISRGELVEIGGGFRVPEVMEASGAKLVEVGATNKTRVADYEKAVTPNTAMFLKVHRSNFTIEGFVATPETQELAALARKCGVPLVEDLGSGAVMRTDQLAPIEHEPTPWETLAAGTDLVCFSGDKLLGGPQAGVIAGRRDLVAGVKREPFYRAVRPDKLILTVLQETAAEYLDASAAGSSSTGLPDVPVVRMLATPVGELQARADALVAAVPAGLRDRVSSGPSVARCGGGTMPKAEIPSVAIEVHGGGDGPDLEAVAAELRTGSPAVVGYVDSGRFKLDLRTVFPEQDEVLGQRLAAALTA